MPITELSKTLAAKSKALGAVAAALMLILGILMIIFPWNIITMLTIALLVQGIQRIVKYFAVKEERTGWNLFGGAAHIIFAAAMLFGGPEMRLIGIMTLEMFFAIWVLFAGVMYIAGGFSLKKAGAKAWGWTVVGGVLMILFGILFFAAPVQYAIGLTFTLGIFAGVSLIMGGITGLAEALSSNGNNGPKGKYA